MVARIRAPVLERYWWTGLGKDVDRHVSACYACHVFKVPIDPATEFLYPMKPPARSLEIISIDHMSAISLTPRGERYLIVAINYLSNCVEMGDMASTSSEGVPGHFSSTRNTKNDHKSHRNGLHSAVICFLL